MIALWLPVILYAAGIFVASSLESPPTPENVSDVSLHALAYCGLMLLVVRAVAHATWARVTLSAIAVAFVITVAYGASDEWHQMYVPGRHADIRDLIADAIGALAAGVGVKAWGIIRRL